jgi:hypothetical protein
MNYEQLKARIRAYKSAPGVKLELSAQDSAELAAFLHVAQACFLCELAGEPIPDDLTDFIIEAKE